MNFKVRDKVRHIQETKGWIWEVVDIIGNRMSIKLLRGEGCLSIGTVIKNESSQYYKLIDIGHPYTKIFK